MEAPLHHSPVPMPAPQQAPRQLDAIAAAVLQHASPAVVRSVTVVQNPPPPLPQATAIAMGREECPRCASRDTKFCYYNNYNTAQPRHFCRACRRYWTLGGSLRNVPVGGSTRRKRPRPARPTRALAAAVANAASSSLAPPPTTTTIPASSSSCGPLASPVAAPAPAPALSGGLISSLLLGAAPLFEGRLGFDPGLGHPSGAADLAQQLGFGAGPRLWPAPTVSQEPAWKTGGMFPPAAAALWQEEHAAAAPLDHAGGLLHQHHGAPPPLLL